MTVIGGGQWGFLARDTSPDIWQAFLPDAMSLWRCTFEESAVQVW